MPEEKTVEGLLRQPRPWMLDSLAAEFGITEKEAALLLPDGMCEFAPGAEFEDVWAGISRWEKATFIIRHLGHVIEIPGKIKPGKMGRGYYNIMGEDGLCGHIKADSITDIAYLSMPFMGRESHSIQFFGSDGSVMFSVYLGRRNHELIPSVKEDFLAMKAAAARSRNRKQEHPMRLLVVYSSVTGNTKKVAEAIASAVPGCDIFPVSEAPSAEGYDLVAAGYWVDKGMPDAKCRAWLETLSNCRIAFFGTLGAWPDSDHAKECMARAAVLAESPERGNSVCGSWLCQGAIDPHIIEIMAKTASDVHPMTPERRARIEEAKKHPDTDDLESACKYILTTIESLESN